MSNGWIDGKFETIIYFFISYPQRTMFLKLVDASHLVKDEKLLSGLLDEIKMKFGVENVVQIIIDNVSNYVVVGELLDTHPIIFWTPCVAHYLDLMLENIDKLEWVNKVAKQAKSITKYIYNHTWGLNLVKKNTWGGELVKLSIT
jgi:hypothetical protein